MKLNELGNTIKTGAIKVKDSVKDNPVDFAVSVVGASTMIYGVVSGSVGMSAVGGSLYGAGVTGLIRDRKNNNQTQDTQENQNSDIF